MYFKLQVTIATELLVDAARYNLSQKWTKPSLTLFTKTMDYYFNRAIVVYLRPRNVSNVRTIQFIWVWPYKCVGCIRNSVFSSLPLNPGIIPTLIILTHCTAACDVLIA